jgi:hypothetical protein
MPDQPSITIDVTAKVKRITADVELYADGAVIGTTTVDLTPLADDTDEAVRGDAIQVAVDDARRRAMAPPYPPGRF